MKPEEALKDIAAGQFASIYLLMGDEPYFLDRVADALEEKVLTADEKAFNQSILYGKDTEVGTVISEARRFPMMSERVLVMVKEAQELKKLDELVRYAEQPQPSTVLVLLYKYKSLDKRSKLYKILEKNHVVVESKKLYDSQLPQWIEGFLRGRGWKVSPKAAALMAEHLGNDLGRIASEVEKLQMVIPKGGDLTAETIETHVGISKEFNQFELVKALGERNLGKAIAIAKYFEANPKDHPLVVTLAALYQFWTKIIVFHSLPGASPQALAAAMKVNPYFIKDYVVAARNYTVSHALLALQLLREYDGKAKGVNNQSASDGALLLEYLFRVMTV